jgi:hypothetical protein
MDFTMTTRRVALTLAAAAALLVLLATVAAGPAGAAPRMGITRARGLPAQSTVPLAGGLSATHALTAASITAPITHREDYFVMPWGAAWAIGAVGALLLLSGASRYARAQRRGSRAEPAELSTLRPPAEERRRAA